MPKNKVIPKGMIILDNRLNLPCIIDFSTGSLGPLRGSNIGVSSGKLYIDTTLGSELIQYGDMETDSVWVSMGTPTTQARSNEQAHAGTYSRKVVTDGASEGIRQDVTATDGAWYLYTGWLYLSVRGSGDSLMLSTYNPTQSTEGLTSTGSWVQELMGFRATSTTVNVRGRNNAAVVSTFYCDDFSMKQITFTTMLAAGLRASQQNVIVKATWAADRSSLFGVAACLDSYTNPQNGLFAHHNGKAGRITLSKLVSGTWTALIDYSSAAYVADAYVEIRKNGNSVGLYYNGSQIGTTQTVSDASLTNNKLHAPFASSSGPKCGKFEIYPN